MPNLLKEALDVMKDGKELHVFKGLLMNPIKTPKETGEYYYTFNLKCNKKFADDDEYGNSYNMYHMVIPSEKAQNFTVENVTKFKNNEVVILANTKASVRKKDEITFNNITFYVQAIELSREVFAKDNVRRMEVI